MLAVLVVCVQAFAVARIAAEQAWGAPQLVLILSLVLAAPLVVGVSLETAVFGAVALLPTLHNTIPMGPFSAVLPELYFALFVGLFVLGNRRFRITPYLMLAAGAFVATIASLLGSPLGSLSFGMVVRFGVLLAFIALVVSRPSEKNLFSPVYAGLIAIPLVALASYAGAGYLLEMVTVNLFQGSRVLYSQQYPIWFSFFFVIAVARGVSRPLLLLIGLALSVIIILSFSRSVLLGVMAAGMLYVLFYDSNRPFSRTVTKVGFLAIGAAGTFVANSVLGFFEFTSTTTERNVWRFQKLRDSYTAFQENPFFGSGFGASSGVTFTQRTGIPLFDANISPEFGPMAVLTELGVFGALFIFPMILIFLFDSVRCLQDPTIPDKYKAAILIVFGGFVAQFLSSNALQSVAVFVFLIPPTLLLKASRTRRERWRTASHDVIVRGEPSSMPVR